MSDANSSCELSILIFFVMFRFSGGLVYFSYSVTHCLYKFSTQEYIIESFFFQYFGHLKIKYYELYHCSNEILKCCNIYQSLLQIPSQKTLYDGNKSWAYHPFLPIIWLSKAKHIKTSWYFFFLSVKYREVYPKLYLKLFKILSLPSLASYGS